MPISHLIVQRWPLLEHAPPEVVQALAAHGGVHAFRKRGLALPGTCTAGYLAWVVQGRVQAIDFTLDAREFVAASYSCGEVFGELGLFAAGTRSPTGMGWSYVGATDGSCAYLPLSALEQAGMHWPALWERIARVAIERLNDWGQWRRLMISPNAVERVEAALAWLAGRDVTGQGWLPDGLTQQEIAAYANTTRETVTRVMQKLQADGRVARTDQRWRWMGTLAGQTLHPS